MPLLLSLCAATTYGLVLFRFGGAKEWFDKKTTRPTALVARIDPHLMDSLMDSDDNRLDMGVAVIVTLLLSFCLWPLVWELTSAVLRYL